jgi:hypothetical protein
VLSTGWVKMNNFVHPGGCRTADMSGRLDAGGSARRRRSREYRSIEIFLELREALSGKVVAANRVCFCGLHSRHPQRPIPAPRFCSIADLGARFEDG